MTDEIPETGAVFTFGKSHFADNEPSHFFIKSDPVVAISCGDEHSAVICQNGRVFVFGGNAWGQLGLGHKDEVTRPSCVKWLKPHRTMFVACGRAHTVFVTDNSTIYSVGCNDEGQLGTGDMEHHTVPQCVELEDDAGAVRQVSAGSNHTAILTESGRVFVCGSNSEGQLGLGEDTRSAVKFTELKFMEKIAFVECGYYHTVFITAKGAVFVTGDNENNKLGIPNPATTVYVPEVLPTDVPIKSACCGASHTFLLSMDESKILAFGSNERGQLGMPKDVDNVAEPTEIDMDKMFDGFQLKLVACGAMHTAFVTDNGLLYTCGESRHNKLCLEEIDDDDNANEAVPNQYSPKRVTAMNGYVVDNVACGGCHTLITATKGSNADFTNNDFNIINEDNRQITLTELPPLQKVPGMIKSEDITIEDVTNSNTNEHVNVDNMNGNANDDIASIDSLEANVSGSHIVNINDLDNDTGSTHDVPDINKDENDTSLPITIEIKDTIADMHIIEKMDHTVDTAVEKVEDKVNEVVKDVSDKVKEKKVVVEDTLKKTMALIPDIHHDDKKILKIPDKIAEIANSPPPKTPIIQDLLTLPDLSQMSPISKHSDDGQKSEAEQSENETIPCGSDKSSPQAGKTAKTQAVMPIVRSEDAIDSHDGLGPCEESDVVVKEQGRFAKFFQSIRDKENSCMSKGKVIEENVVENIHKGLDGTEQTIHKIEDTVETEIRNQTNSRTCTIL
ncbi:probable E3 ubiquitin-protein ligase HERC3 [Plodia interpunctella]|uniref:probable E3 ubiquitin-protein ligase HERC3 n=1 Tax=Plodia interpunctella TaxID=58824 RepID=UPI002367E3DF|nr:probable E3 ubiquitin-protein ligase HERC3 [Plodia interpunctella]